MNYTNPIEYPIDLTPVLTNIATEGGLDTSVLNGVSLQRTVNMVMTRDQQGNVKVIGSRRDGESYDDVVSYVSGWKTVLDTIWLYPVADVNSVLEDFRESSPPIVEEDERIVFEDIDHLYDFYNDVCDSTNVAQPVGNVGYSLGIGTRLRDLGITVHLELASGLKVVTWRLVKQLTSQADLPVGGDSPDDTIGFILIYCDWNQDGFQDALNLNPVSLGFSNADPLRVEQI
jgi:hypothetical protein